LPVSQNPVEDPATTQNVEECREGKHPDMARRKTKIILNEAGSIPHNNPNSFTSSNSYNKREEDSKKV
jgi:hypothetical protein